MAVKVQRDELMRVSSRIPDISSSIHTNVWNIKKDIADIGENITNGNVTPVVREFNEKLTEILNLVEEDLNELKAFVDKQVGDYQQQEEEMSQSLSTVDDFLSQID